MTWRKSPDALVQAFDHGLPIVAGVQRKAMFGYPCAFVNGHLFCGLHQDSIIVRLPEARRDALVAEGAITFEPMPGHAMKEYVVAPPEIVADRERLRGLLREALAYASSLAPKPKKSSQPSTKKTTAKRKPASEKTAPVAGVPASSADPGRKTAAREASAKKTRSR